MGLGARAGDGMWSDEEWRPGEKGGEFEEEEEGEEGEEFEEGDFGRCLCVCVCVCVFVACF